VIGLPDEEWGERVVAIVVAGAERRPETLRDWVKARLRSTKTPEEIIFLDALPYNETGKLLRRTLKLQFSAEPQASKA
jgi:fatty-acyl-CoA synthase